MIERTYTIRQYEVGDVLDLSDVHPKFRAKKCLNSAVRAMVFQVNMLANGMITYKVITDNGYTTSFTHDEQGKERYIGHIDMSILFPPDDEKTAR